MQNLIFPYEKQGSLDDIQLWKRNLAQWCFFNFFLVATIGLGLRSFSVFSIPFLNYKFVIHAHSHFAFGGWIMPALLLMIVKFFPAFLQRISLRDLRMISGTMIFSAYGMLLTFPFMGYAAASISFSTINMFAGLYMAVKLWKAMKGENSIPYYFLRAGLVFLALSSLGPLATAPLVATGNGGTPLYSNSIYFYLHFQYNGWFTFAVLAVVYAMIGDKARHGRLAFWLLAAACIPAYFLSILWIRPPAIFYIISFIAAATQLAGAFLVLRDFFRARGKWEVSGIVISIAMLVFLAKNLIQLASSFPEVVDMATSRRNFIIAYLHMVLLGFVSLFLIGSIVKGFERYTRPIFSHGLILFFLAFLVTETLLVLNASGIWIELGNYAFVELIFIASIFLPAGIFLIWQGMAKAYPRVVMNI